MNEVAKHNVLRPPDVVLTREGIGGKQEYGYWHSSEGIWRSPIRKGLLSGEMTLMATRAEMNLICSVKDSHPVPSDLP